MTKKKLLLIAGGVIVIGGGIYYNLTLDTTKSTVVDAAEVKTARVTETVSASGRIQPQSKVNITSQVNGEIISLLAKEGEYVRAGQTLIVLDTVQLKSDFEQARYSLDESNARLEGARATLEQRRDDFNRKQKLHEKGLTSEQDFLDSKYAFINSESALNAAVAQAKQAQFRKEKQLDNLDKATIVAPMSGTLTLVDVEVGEIAPAQTSFTQGKTLMTISNLDVFEVEVEVDETEINKIAINQMTEIEIDAFPDTTFPGRVVEIGNTAILLGGGTQDQSTNFKVKVIFEDVGVKIRPGMSATVDITTASRDNVTIVPFSAIVMRKLNLDSLIAARVAEASGSTLVSEVQAAEPADSMITDSATTVTDDDSDDEEEEYKGVFVIRDGKALFVEVTTGIADSRNVEVVTGLEPGDSVVSGPYRVLRTIKDNDVVKIEEDKKSGEKR